MGSLPQAPEVHLHLVWPTRWTGIGEASRNGGRVAYRAAAADATADRRALRPKPAKLATNGRLRAEVTRGLGLEWSPQQIA